MKHAFPFGLHRWSSEFQQESDSQFWKTFRAGYSVLDGKRWNRGRLGRWKWDSAHLWYPGPSLAGGASGARPPIWNMCAPFHFGRVVAAYIQYSISKMYPPSGFWLLLLLFSPPAAKLWRRACWYLSQSLRSMMKSFRITVCLCLFLIIPTLCQLILEIHT